ncbi:phage head completion protein [Dyadobacter sandarakinus]|uniref:Head-tail adaptor protein n=1 Tax=Dyadobacter sandarakinus TaxID=2747268 RepID=A0ABX7I1N8_9BACT|nr:head-tail adaptor protein [Dyadobacter sandarakinus]QRQ99713.1 head-tail adaptor protein [Dyadobacter sandarakinus]
MATQDRLAGKYDRRIDLLRADTDTDDPNNEQQTIYVAAFENFPACKLESKGQDEELDGNSLKGSIIVSWQIRYIPTIAINTTWKIRDTHDGLEYELVGPPIEIGRRQALKLNTRLVQ